MKKHLLQCLTLCALFLVAVGCSKQENPYADKMDAETDKAMQQETDPGDPTGSKAE